jgi:hypothetical protein
LARSPHDTRFGALDGICAGAVASINVVASIVHASYGFFYAKKWRYHFDSIIVCYGI